VRFRLRLSLPDVNRPGFRAVVRLVQDSICIANSLPVRCLIGSGQYRPRERVDQPCRTTLVHLLTRMGLTYRQSIDKETACFLVA
jgi:hypothetical protein